MLSRPVLAPINLLVANESEDSYEKCLDIYEYEPLLTFVRTGRHIPGASQNILRRVNQISKSYKFDGENILFRIFGNENFLIILFEFI